MRAEVVVRLGSEKKSFLSQEHVDVNKTECPRFLKVKKEERKKARMRNLLWYQRSSAQDFKQWHAMAD